MNTHTIEFGEWRFEPQRNRLSKNDQVVHLEHRAVEVLHYLVRHPGETVSFDELLDNVWPDRVVELNVVHRNVSRIRQALGDDPHAPQYIETISKRGYRTVANVANVERQQPHTTRPKQTQWIWLLFIVAVVLSGFAGFAYLGIKDAVPLLDTTPQNTLAVLPFENLSPDESHAFFADGMHEEVINRLFQISDLSIISRTSTLQYTNTSKSVQHIASELRVAYILSGSVRYMDDQVRLAVQLLDGTNGSHIWAQTYDRKIEDLFRLQDEIASQIVSRLSATLVKSAKQSRRRNSTAYLKYLQARHLLSLGDASSARFSAADALLQDALAIDPSDITVMMELARLWLQRDKRNNVPSEVALPPRRKMILDALAIDPDHAVANAWLGWQALFSDNDLEKAARQYEKATHLEPRNVNILRGMVEVLLEFGRPRDAQIVAEYVVQYDPVCVICLVNLAGVQLIQGEYPAAVMSASSALALAPQNTQARLCLSAAQSLSGDPKAALQTLELEMASPEIQALRIVAWRALGLHEQATSALAVLQAEHPNAFSSLAIVYAAMGATDQAFERLETALSPGNLETTAFGVSQLYQPYFNSLRQDPRWLNLLTKIGRAPRQLEVLGFQPKLPSD